MPLFTTRSRLLHLPLYVRIWFAVVLAVAMLTLLAGWIMRVTAEPPLRDVMVRNVDGDLVGQGQARLRPPDGFPLEAPPPTAPDMPHPPGHYGTGPEFMVRMHSGELMHIHLPRPPRSFWSRPPYGFFWTLGLVGIAVALGTYPIVRRLTRRLEHLQKGVEQWGTGNLSARVAEEGHDEVTYLAQRFNHAAAKVEQLVTSHKSLLANASHELRSPLTRIRMGLELMGDTPSPAMKAEISRSVGELDQLIDEILLASRLDAKAMDLGTLEQVDLTGLATEECARFDATLDLGEHPQSQSVPGVAKLLRRMLRNLLENARRYGTSDIQVGLARVTRNGKSWLQLNVADRGPGVPADLRERIFEPFYRLPGASEREGGVGLGLALVRSIVQRHGGEVHCEDRGGGGANFVVMLPI
ncbi:sensor histidine kinase KdpD [Limnohabitans sp. B9-3]|uniref:sensor histidine kinase n=1 Tax=Limnohabitans sp. B9-3 TaxID=1100707 RepID=UPI000CAC01A8|nr:ATP-binding protein [Limnohabitans sp. B9-3]PIT71320.1 two-component sensor histidine kinase [Limnohabitans sp. B9-3]